MLDSKTLETIDEALDIVLDNLVKNNAFKLDSPYAQRFYLAQKSVRTEMINLGKNRKRLATPKRSRTRC